MKRRTVIGAASAAALPSGFFMHLASAAARTTALKPLGAAQRFDVAWTKGRARALAAAPYQAHAGELPRAVAALDYDQFQAIRFKADHALWADGEFRTKVEFTHLGMFFKRPVKMYEVVDGLAQELAYDPAMFDYGKSGLNGKRLPADLGFSGFKMKSDLAPRHDAAVFQGASYFRATSGTRQYGISARGLAVDTALDHPEEFPDFVAFYFERPARQSNVLVVHALLDSPSITGAYRFAITSGDTTRMEIDSALYPRKTIERLGIAPCTSMFQNGENDHRVADDWRPEIHDSDGLSIQTGSGEWIWRPLRNPKTLSFNAFADTQPRGFGLLQRDTDFADYQDDGAFYDKRPSLWVEPRGSWGAGAVDLIEIPTIDETSDNIVAFWNPATKPQPGQELLFSYVLHWCRMPPVQPALARCTATRTGAGGIVGQKHAYASRRFTIDFAGGDLALLDPQTPVEPVISVSRGRVEITSARPLASIGGYRAMFDLVPDGGAAPITMRLFLRAADGQALSETWLYEWALGG